MKKNIFYQITILLVFSFGWLLVAQELSSLNAAAEISVAPEASTPADSLTPPNLRSESDTSPPETTMPLSDTTPLPDASAGGVTDATGPASPSPTSADEAVSSPPSALSGGDKATDVTESNTARNELAPATVLPTISTVDKNQKEKTQIQVKQEDVFKDDEEKAARALRIGQSLSAHIDEFLYPWEPENENQLIKVNFQNASLAELMLFMEENYNVTFLTDEALTPASANAGKLSASTITFRSHTPLNKKELWNLFTTFLDMGGFAVVPGNNPRIFQIVSAAPGVANKMPLPSYIGVDYNQLPDSDIKIRYVYFVENAEIPNLISVIDSMRSNGSSQAVPISEMRAILMTDRASNIRAIMKIIKELDTVTSPEVMSIIRLNKATASQVAEFYAKLTQEEPGGLMSRFGGLRKEPAASPFARARVIADPRTNSLFVFGTRESVPIVEDFIKSHIDRDIPIAYGGTQIYRAKHVDAVATADILQRAINFDPGTPASIYGGIRDGEKYFKSDLRFIPEKTTNSIIIKGEYEDYLKILEVLKKIDVEQPQVAIRVVIVDVNISDNRQLGTQLRNTNYGINPGTLGPTGLEGIAGRNVTFQTSGLGGTSPIIENPQGTGAVRLLGDLIALAQSPSGSSLITLGQDAFGVWGLVRLLQAYTETTVIANPFLLTTHNYEAQVSVGEERRVLSGTVSGGAATQAGKTSIKADLTVKVKPIISADGLINLDVDVDITDFTSPDVNSGNRLKKHINTKALVDNKEVLALGGFVSNRVDEVKSKVPVLGDIPIVGWLFKNRSKLMTKTSLLILISAEIIESHTDKSVDAFTQDKVDEATHILAYGDNENHRRDPIYRWFFNDSDNNELKSFNDFLKVKNTYISDAEKLRREQKANPNIIVAQKEAKKKQAHNKKPIIVASKAPPSSTSKKGKKILQLIDEENNRITV